MKVKRKMQFALRSRLRRFREFADHSGSGALTEQAAANFMHGIAVQNSIRDAGG